MEIKALCQTLSKAFDMSSATAKDSPKFRNAEDQVSERRDRRSPLERSFVTIRDKIKRFKVLPNLPVEDRFENFRRMEVKAIGR